MRQALFGSTRVLLVLALLTATACGGDNPFGVVVDEGGDFVVTVTGDGNATYDWEGGNARILVALRASDGVQLWRIDAVSGGEGFAGPVTHGFVPVGTTETVDSEVLASGVEYRVEITLMDGRTSSATFVR